MRDEGSGVPLSRSVRSFTAASRASGRAADGRPSTTRPKRLPSCVGGAISQIDGDHRADLEAIDRPRAREVAPDRAGRCRDEHVVDGGRRRVDVLLTSASGSGLDQATFFWRPRGPFSNVFGSGGSATRRPKEGRACESRDCAGTAPSGRRPRERAWSSPSQSDNSTPRSANPSAMAWWIAVEQRRPCGGAIDHVPAPERTNSVEQSAHRAPEERAERGVVGGVELHVLDVFREVEVATGSHRGGPACSARSTTRARKRGIDDDTFEQRVDPIDRKGLGELQHAVDDHRVGLVLHVQPCGVLAAEHVLGHGSSSVGELVGSRIGPADVVPVRGSAAVSGSVKQKVAPAPARRASEILPP